MEDEPHLADTLRRGLVAEGILVELAVDGQDGLWRGTERTYDVIVLDIMLPEMHGYDVLKHLRAREVWTPVLMLTAKDGDYDQTDAFDLGADDYLSKPVRIAVLVARLRALQRRGVPARPVVLRAGPVSLDPQRRRVARGDVEITLTPREYGVLEHLLRRAGTVVTKSELLRSVWDEHYEGDDNVVEVYVGYLRRKLDTPFGTRSIETVRGAGYRFTASGE